MKTVGDASETLVATIAPANATNKAVTWSSSDSNVATVTNGTVSFVAAGSATITATTVDGGFTATCVVTVEQLPPLPVFEGLPEECTVGSTIPLKVKGVGSEKLTVFSISLVVNGKVINTQTTNTFTPTTKGTYLVEASTSEGDLRITRIIIVI
jgi:hypothetical protein